MGASGGGSGQCQRLKIHVCGQVCLPGIVQNTGGSMLLQGLKRVTQ